MLTYVGQDWYGLYGWLRAKPSSRSFEYMYEIVLLQ